LQAPSLARLARRARLVLIVVSSFVACGTIGGHAFFLVAVAPSFEIGTVGVDCEAIRRSGASERGGIRRPRRRTLDSRIPRHESQYGSAVAEPARRANRFARAEC
jgi:hypothetical protein